MKKIDDIDLLEIRAQIEALSTLFWHWKDENSLPDNFGFGIGLLLHGINKQLEAIAADKAEK